MKIDVSTDFTLDTPHYWEGFWDRYDGLGIGGSDPDANSETLRQYHQIVWSRALPCGEKMNLQRGQKPYYLSWNGFHFSSDSIIAGFRYTKYRGMLDGVVLIHRHTSEHAHPLCEKNIDTIFLAQGNMSSSLTIVFLSKPEHQRPVFPPRPL